MPDIRPISDLRNKAKDLSRLCHDTGEPVFITKNGEGDLVVLSIAAWERMQGELELLRLLGESEETARRGDRGIGIKAMWKKLGRRPR